MKTLAAILAVLLIVFLAKRRETAQWLAVDDAGPDDWDPYCVGLAWGTK